MKRVERVVRAAAVFALALAACTLVDPLDGLSDNFGRDAAPAIGTDAGEVGTVDRDANVDVDADAMPSVCDPTEDFGAPVLLSSIDTAEEEGSARIDVGGHALYFDAVREAGAGGSTFDLFSAAFVDEEQGLFAAAVRVEGPSTDAANEYAPALTDDGLTLFFERQTTVDDPNSDIYVSVRASRTSPFGPGVLVAGIDTSDYEGNPFVRGDGSDLWFAATGADTSIDVFHATRTPGGYAARPVDEIVSPDDDSSPVISADGLTLYFASSRPLGGAAGKNIWVATRRTPGETFARPAPVRNVNSDAFERPTWISADGCRLYLQSDRTGGLGRQDLYVAKRAR